MFLKTIWRLYPAEDQICESATGLNIYENAVTPFFSSYIYIYIYIYYCLHKVPKSLYLGFSNIYLSICQRVIACDNK